MAAQMPRTITTERLSLRYFEPDDTVWHRRLVAERVNPNRRHPPQADPAVVQSIVDGTERGWLPLYVVLPEATGEPVGYCGLIVGRASTAEPEIAYELFREFHGRGYATEAARGVVTAAAAAGFSRLWATVGDWNDDSFRVLDKLGFVRDHSTKSDGETLVWCRLDTDSLHGAG